MAYEIPVLQHPLMSTGGSTGDQFKAVVATTAGGYADGYRVVAARAGAVTGVLQENSTEAAAQRVMFMGISKVQAGDSSGTETAITFGSEVIASSQGQAVASSSGGLPMLGLAMGSLSTGSTGVISVFLTPGAHTST